MTGQCTKESCALCRATSLAGQDPLVAGSNPFGLAAQYAVHLRQVSIENVSYILTVLTEIIL